MNIKKNKNKQNQKQSMNIYLIMSSKMKLLGIEMWLNDMQYLSYIQSIWVIMTVNMLAIKNKNGTRWIVKGFNYIEG